jgi:transcription factor SPN1
MADAETTQTQATQPELKQLMNDIFGLSDDEEEEAPVAQAVQPVARQSDDAQLFDDESDSDDAQPALRKLSRFSKGKKDSQKARAKSTEPKKRKRLEKAKPERKRREPAADSAAPSAGKEKRREREEDEDSYASESDIEATAEDQAFIDMEGEDAELMREYEEENPQHFHDERPDRRRDEAPKVLNVVDEAVMALKKPKPVSLEGEEKRRLAEDLVEKMRVAAEADRQSRANNQPALEKLRVLPLVRQRVVNRQLQEELLESNLLTAFKAWLEPPAPNELPTLELRSALYKMLYDLPIEASHLRHSHVGQIVMALYKHPKETVQHKKLLESIIQKWSRLIFVSDRHVRAHRGFGLMNEL